MKLVILYGPPATGKLTLAKEISKKLGYKIFDNHQTMDFLNSVVLDADIARKLQSKLPEYSPVCAKPFLQGLSILNEAGTFTGTDSETHIVILSSPTLFFADIVLPDHIEKKLSDPFYVFADENLALLDILVQEDGTQLVKQDGSLILL